MEPTLTDQSYSAAARSWGGASAGSRTFALALTALAWFAVLLQCWLSLATATHNGKTIASGMVSFLGYFTIVTNLLVCISLTMPLLAPASAMGKFFSRADTIAAVATSILFVGISYHVLLRNTWNPQGLSMLATMLLHYAIPILYFVYWWFNSPKTALRWIYPVLWGLYPTAYLIYALIRGKIIGSYPYTFIDAAAIGYAQTFINGVGLLAVFIVLGLMLVALNRMRSKT
jgi:hypothetical protein